MRRRRGGRPRKPGARHRSGDLKRQAETPRLVAAGMPHRRGLGDRAVDQRAETELGRLVLRGAIDATLGLAGETYLALWRGYVMSIAGPAELGHGGGHGFTCDGCEVGTRFCRCEFRRRIYCEADRALSGAGARPRTAVHLTVIHGLPAVEVGVLRVGLGALAVHFGLTRRQIGILGNAASQTVSPPAR